MKNEEEKLILVVGLGEIGRPLFELIAEKYPTARGIDKEPVAIEEPVGLMHICFPHDLPNGFVAVTDGYARKYKPELIVLHSTVHPGTSRQVEEKTGIPTVFSPVRGKHVRMRKDLLHYQKFAAGCRPEAVQRVTHFLDGLGLKTSTMKTPEALELAKLLETSYFGILLAWAQEMDRFADKAGAEYLDMSKFFEEIDYLPRVIFTPGFIGGHCVIPNIEILKTCFQSQFLDVIINSNNLKASEIQAAGGSLTERVSPIRLDKSAP